jgi:hypothetical protein
LCFGDAIVKNNILLNLLLSESPNSEENQQNHIKTNITAARQKFLSKKAKP